MEAVLRSMMCHVLEYNLFVAQVMVVLPFSFSSKELHKKAESFKRNTMQLIAFKAGAWINCYTSVMKI